jgi:N-acylglucosamine 2-epimerase
VTPGRIDELIPVYRDGLLEDTLPFWVRHGVDREHGGFLFCLDRDGAVVDTDKGLWQHGRFVWLLATLYNRVEPRGEWLELARHGVEFLHRHGFDSEGRMYFQVTREGAPLRKRRYVFTEAFGAIALAAYARASGDEGAADQARALFRLVVRYATTPGLIPPKVDPSTRPSKGLALPMILLATAQVLRDDLSDPLAEEWIDRAIDEIRRDFVKPDLQVVMETVGPNGELLDHFDGRTLNPGHALEAAWFILAEAWRRGGDAELTGLGTSMVDWMWRRGWDEEHGGILYFRDLRGLPVQEYWHDMKFWWPHNEAILATLMAHRATGEPRYARWHQMVHDWAHRHFPDPEHGEWFGYLHRDGRRSVTLKGNLWKGPFHLPRMQLRCWQALEGMRDRADTGAVG